MPRERQEKWRSFLLALLLTLVPLAMIMVVTVMAVQPSMPREQHRSDYQQETQPNYRPQPDDTLTVAVVGLSGGRAGDVLLIRFNPQYGQVPLSLLPANTLVTLEEETVTLEQAYAKGGGPAVKSALSQRLGVAVDRYAALSRDLLIRLVEKTGSVKFDVPLPIQYTRDGYSIDIPQGLRQLDGRDIVDILSYPNFSNAAEKSRVLGDLVAACINQNLDAAGEERSSGLFKFVVNLVDTDVNFADYELRRQSADFISRLDAQVAGNLPVSGSLLESSGALELSEAYSDTIRRYFQAVS